MASTVARPTISPKTSLLFLAEEGKDFISSSEKVSGSTESDGSTFFGLMPKALDIRSSFRLVLLLVILSPLYRGYFTYRTCFAVVVASYAGPAIIRTRYPRFMEVNILDDLRIEAGATLSLFASITALLLQAHNTSISIAVKFHSEFYSRPLTRLLRTYLYVEMALNGTSEEKEQTASWLRWMHRHIHGSITDEMREELGIPEDVETYGYIDELKAYIMYTLTWATISFQTRFGRPLSKRAKDTIVLEYACAGMRIGVPQDLLSKDYDSFLIAFDQRLDILDAGYSLTRVIVENVEGSVLSAKKNIITAILVRIALMIGYDLLPTRVREKYQLKILSTWWQRAIQKILIAVLWVIYPMLMWVPLRGMICLLLVLEPQLRSIFMSSLQAIHSMDILSDKPVYSKGDTSAPKSEEAIAYELPSYLLWLESGKDGRPFLQAVLVRILATQLNSAQAASQSRWSAGRLMPWLQLPGRLFALALESIRQNVVDMVSCWRTQLKESMTFNGEEVKMPLHIGFVMDGNRRYARNLGQPIIVGHQRGAQTAGNILEWWLRFMPNAAKYSHKSLGPQYLTVWAFSAENFKRTQEELDGLFRLMTAEFKSLAYTSIVHLFQIRVRVIGSRDGLPRELLDSIELLEETTGMYSRLYLQVAVGYGGRDEIVRSVNSALARGEEITEDAISRGTFCASVGVPPVDLIVRTSERRTSGFFLWDTQTAELHFINKLWPELNEGDWLDAVASFAVREMRGGK
ncbi:hypothetical protein CVT25_002431 [Psilocybe cyanescens]|uniref:ER-bound oxygenase mpaB/mpaB'/Rubber oxygenase catalytic domain-containing protein n=1 Tax=Psilocybe cyanescens TaxID=93625 RepID=A0A409WJY8_PSICY|nr:hypothetical protein CVT25_002431 [Psilocybe cyanescens]